MLRRLSTVAAAAAMLGICALPATANAQADHPSHGTFTVPSANSTIKASGSYTFTTFHKKNVVKIQICATLKGGSAWVLAEAVSYNSNRKSHQAIAAAVSQQTPGHKSCALNYLPYTSHLKVFTEIGGSNGKIAKKSSMKSIY
ncbi:MAG TPA: hypothetical protein VGG16_25240 [Streptosporangiaceae bacterium]|jgi:hypothetical protein